ncbi:MAG: hypothetical protein ACYDAP_02105 [Thermoplasmataceae archaeon]
MNFFSQLDSGLLTSLQPDLQPATETATTTTGGANEKNLVENTGSASQYGLDSQPSQPQPGLNGSDLTREGYRGMGHEENSGTVSKGDTASLNTKNEDLPGKKQEDPAIADPETMAAEDLAADAFELFMELVQDPEKRKALESDPVLNAEFHQLMRKTITTITTVTVITVITLITKSITITNTITNKKLRKIQGLTTIGLSWLLRLPHARRGKL